MEYFFQLADVRIRVESPFPLLDNESTIEFFSDTEKDICPNLEISYLPVNELPAPEDIRYEEARRVYTGEGDSAATLFSEMPGIPAYAWVPRESLSRGKLICYYLPGKEYLMNYKRNILTLMDLEATLLHFNAIIMHASLIRWNEQAIIFSAPSGVGKSTQAELWKQYAGADILNGDRAALRKKDGVWHGYGLPYAGTSGIYRNENAPLRAIVALRQAPENSIRKLNVSDAFRYLYPETMIHRWDAEFERMATALLLDVLNVTPVYLLSCRPDREAVELLKDELEPMEKRKKSYDPNSCRTETDRILA